MYGICAYIDPLAPPQLIGTYGSPMECLGKNRCSPSRVPIVQRKWKVPGGTSPVSGGHTSSSHVELVHPRNSSTRGGLKMVEAPDFDALPGLPGTPGSYRVLVTWSLNRPRRCQVFKAKSEHRVDAPGTSMPVWLTFDGRSHWGCKCRARSLFPGL